jgi:hypothetical protein
MEIYQKKQGNTTSFLKSKESKKEGKYSFFFEKMEESVNKSRN